MKLQGSSERRARNGKSKLAALALSAFTALFVCLLISNPQSPALGETTDATTTQTQSGTIAETQNLDATESAANRWQVISGEYTGNASQNKTTSTDGTVRAQKNVVATDTENEFLIYESIDVKQRFADYFASAEYMATTSNNYHDSQLGTVVGSMTGNMKVQVTGHSGQYSNSGSFDILSSSGELLAEDITLYWSQANNVTFFLKVDDSHYVLLGVKVRNGSQNAVMLSEEAEELIMSKTAQYAAISSVSDQMGSNIEYVETVSCDGSTAYDSSTSTLTWKPQSKTNPTIEKTRTGESKTVTFTDHNGSVRTETVYKYDSWATNVSELVYKVRLKPTVSTGLAASGNALPEKAADAAENALTNGSATVNYSEGSLDLPSPVVRGMLYQLKLAKTDDASPAHALAGAQFALYRDATCTDLAATAESAVDDSGQAVLDFPNLQCGTYYLKETAAPAGYEIPTDANGQVPVTEYQLCYTDENARALLTGQNTAATPNEEALVDKTSQPISNKQTIQFTLKKTNFFNQRALLEGARYRLYVDNTSDNVDGQRRFTSADTKTDFVATTDANGCALFTGLTRDATYWIVEEQAPTGMSVTSQENTPYVVVSTDADTGKLVVSGTYLTGNSASQQQPVPDITVSDTPLALRIIKTSGTGSAALADAEFTLYTDEACTMEASGLYSDAALTAEAPAAQQTADDGSLTWFGMPAGTYYLKETRSPAGYQLFDQVIRVAVNQDGTATATMDADGDGTPETAALNVDDETHGLAKVADNVPYLVVSDDPIAQLPTTSGPGTRALILAGLALVALGTALGSAYGAHLFRFKRIKSIRER